MKIYKIAQSTPYSAVAYHGTIYPFDKFDVSRIGSANDFGTIGKGFYFTLDPNVAQSYARTAYKRFLKAGGDISKTFPRIITVNINLQNAMNTSQRTMRSNYQGNTPEEQSQNMTTELTKNNIDGVLLSENQEISEIIVFDPSKITIQSSNPINVSDIQIPAKKY